MRRSLTRTTAAAGALLAGLCFIPSASATVEHGAASASGAASMQATSVHGTTTAAADARGTARATGGAGTTDTTDTTGSTGTSGTAGARVETQDLAETGSMDTSPYLVGGTGFLGVGTVLLVAARRRTVVLR